MVISEGGIPPFIFKKWERSRYLVDFNSFVSPGMLDVFNEGFFYGQFASVCQIDENSYEGVRDPLGIGKLFYCRDEEGTLRFSSRFSDLFGYKSKIYSLPAGYKVRIDSEGVHKLASLSAPCPLNEEMDAAALEEDRFSVRRFHNDFASRMELVFRGLREKEEEGWKIFIALSGGLDSTIIALKSSQYLKSPLACTLDLGKSEDSEKALKIADHIGLEHKVFKASREDMLDALKEAPYGCQDFRDFNVHCAALNILLARHIKELADRDDRIDSEKVLVLTGDLMNEFTCDYAGEVIDGKEYYKLPRVGQKELQNYLIGGLDTSDREVSPFRSYGLHCVQPYAILWDLYASLDESVLLHGDPKKLLNSFMVDDYIARLIPKVKLRAQVGSRENMGILGLCHSLGMNDKTYLHDLLEKAGHPDGRVPLFVGRYDVEKFHG
ncbi:MAG: asparagine synthase-related protein [Spirochaetales bacterium]|nr:asparagine synthase-related protein [Spirochaetales bacterium]